MEFFIYFVVGILLGSLLTLIFCLIIFRKKNDISKIINEELKNTINNISMETLHSSANYIGTSFVSNINNILCPLKESLQHMDQKVSDLELRRQGAYSGLREQIDGLMRCHFDLQKETKHLREAMVSPAIRGRWGEMQLRRCVELSGMSPYCDFVEQSSLKEDNEVFRPDLIITLPKNKKIIVDAKAPLEIDGQEGLPNLFRRHIANLKKKSYFKLLGDTPEFVVMFIPAEGLLAKALLSDPLLIDFAAQMDVLLATPSTLIAILKSVAFSLRQDKVAHNIEEIRRLSQQLLDRIEKVAEHFDKLGKHLKMATETYNQTLSSLDSRVLVTARKIAQIKGEDLDYLNDSVIG